MATPASPPIRVFLLGRFELAWGERTLRAADWTRRKAAHLLQRLALNRRLLKDEAIEFLWPEADPAAGANSLYRTIHALRQTLVTRLGPGAAEATFAFEDGVFTLAGTVWVDVHEFEGAARSSVDGIRSALGLYRGDLLPDEPYAEWTQAPREALRRLHRQASLKLAANHFERRDYAQAAALLTPLVARDPADEPVHRELMRVYALAGRRHEALRQYRACVAALAAELDVPPEPETTAIYSQILAGELVPVATPPPAEGEPGLSRMDADALPPLPVVLDAQRGQPMVGRQAELDFLMARLQRAQQGRGQTILLAGESGAGKTRLAFEALRAAALGGMITLFGAAYEQEGQLPYQPFIEAFDRYLVEGRSSPGASRSGSESQENPITHFRRRGSADPQEEQRAMFNASVAFLEEVAGRAPVVFLVDDLHAADEASLRLFHYLARQTQAARVMLLATYREGATPTVSPFGALIHALYRERLGETLTLAPLSQEAVAQMIAHIFGGHAAPELVGSVYEITEGNAFFTQEIVHALRQTGQAAETDGAWRLSGGGATGTPLRLPRGLSGLLRDQVVRLGPTVESALTAAAVIGREFEFDVLRGMATVADGGLLDALDAALSVHLLEETAAGYRFRHVLIRHVLYDTLSRARRARLHGLTAAKMEALYASRPGGLEPYAEDLAFHYDLSDRRERAVDYLIQAGGKAAGLFAYEVAAQYNERALALLDALGLPDLERRFNLLESLGKVYTVLADTPKAVAAFDQALGSPGNGWQPRPSDRARIRRLAAMGLITAGDLERAASYLGRALADLDEQSHVPELAHVLYNAAQLHWHRNEYQQAFDVAQRSLAAAERLNDTVAVARAFEMLALACHSLGEWQTGLAYEQRRAALAGPALDVTDAFDVHL